MFMSRSLMFGQKGASGVRGPRAGRSGHYAAGTSNRVSMVHTVW